MYESLEPEWDYPVGEWKQDGDLQPSNMEAVLDRGAQQHWEAGGLASSAFPNQPAMQLQSNYLTTLGHSFHICKMLAIYLPESGRPDGSPI